MPQQTVKKKRKGDPIAFRLDEEHDKMLNDRMLAEKVVGVASREQLARKFLVDVLLGRAVYLNPTHRSDNPALG
jgi:hypothetical protein